MTREAMIKVLRYKAENIKTHIKPEFFLEVAEALEPCEDAINRQNLIKDLHFLYNQDGYIKNNRAKRTMEVIMGQASVTPTRKKGYWIQESPKNTFRNYCKCSICGKGETYIKTPYCPNCGAKMIEPHESEE